MDRVTDEDYGAMTPECQALFDGDASAYARKIRQSFSWQEWCWFVWFQYCEDVKGRLKWLDFVVVGMVVGLSVVALIALFVVLVVGAL